MTEDEEKGLKKEKLSLEIDKLRGEIKALRNPILHNPGYLISLIFFAVGVATALINWDAVSKRERLADLLSRETELTFGVSMGRGQGIVTGSERWTLVVHAR